MGLKRLRALLALCVFEGLHRSWGWWLRILYFRIRGLSSMLQDYRKQPWMQEAHHCISDGGLRKFAV